MIIELFFFGGVTEHCNTDVLFFFSGNRKPGIKSAESNDVLFFFYVYIHIHVLFDGTAFNTSISSPCIM